MPIENTQATPQRRDARLAERFGAAIYDPFLWLAERRGMARRRAALLAQARGAVLEIGAGSGLNLTHYPETLDRLVLTEPVGPMARRVERRAEALDRRDAEIVQVGAEQLPFEDDSFDTIVSTLVLCTVPDPERAVDEVQRVLRPGGRLLLIEHVRARGLRGRMQDALAAPWRGFAAGCRCNQETETLLARRFDIDGLQRDRWRGMPSLVHPLVLGSVPA